MGDRMEVMAWDCVKENVNKVEQCYWEHYEHEIDCSNCELNKSTTKLKNGERIEGFETKCHVIFKLFDSEF